MPIREITAGTDTDTLYTEEDFNHAYLTHDNEKVGRIISVQCAKKSIAPRDILRAGFNMNTFNRWKKGKYMPAESNISRLTYLLFNTKDITYEKTDNEKMVDFIKNETGYKYDFEYQMDFNTKREDLHRLAYSTGTTKSLLQESMDISYDEWPDITIIQDMFTMKPISIQTLIDDIAKRLSPDYPEIRNIPFFARFQDYMESKCRMPQKIYDAAIQAIERLPASRMADIPGYMNWRIDILTHIWRENRETAQRKFDSMLDANKMTKRHTYINHNRRPKLYATHRKRASGPVDAINVFDKTCDDWYASAADITQKRAILVNTRESVIQKLTFHMENNDVEKTNSEIFGIKNLFPLTYEETEKQASDDGKEFCPESLKLRNYIGTFTDKRKRSIISSMNVLIDYTADYLAKNPEIQLRYDPT